MGLSATPELVLAGYFPKITTVPANWLGPARVSQICSVSTCIARAPEGWIDHWLHNALGFYDTRENARFVASGGSGDFSIFAYRLLPVRFRDGKGKVQPSDCVSIEPLPESFVSLGFDVVSKPAYLIFFECSPLSCNGLADEVPVNRFCLIDSLDDAIALAERCSIEEPEPGPYYVLEVLRENG